MRDDQDVTGKIAFVTCHDKANSGGIGGYVDVAITSDGLAGLSPAVNFLIQDDFPTSDYYAWDPATATGTIVHRWSSCCTDGFGLGYMPLTDFCLRLDFRTTEATANIAQYGAPVNLKWGPSVFDLQPVGNRSPAGISSFSLMSSVNGNFQYNFITMADMVGMQVTLGN